MEIFFWENISFENYYLFIDPFGLFQRIAPTLVLDSQTRFLHSTICRAEAVSLSGFSRNVVQVVPDPDNIETLSYSSIA